MPIPELQHHSLASLKKLSERARIILGSGSPRRKNFLERAGIDFEIISADIDESLHDSEPPNIAAERLALEKATAITRRNQFDKPTVIITADTIVWLDGKSLGKPVDEEDAFALLSELSGKTHTVFTGIALTPLIPGRRIDRFVEYARTDVTFAELDRRRIREYIATGDPMDKAGAYGAQQHGAFLVDRLQGELDTVIGLPRDALDRLSQLAYSAMFETTNNSR